MKTLHFKHCPDHFEKITVADLTQSLQFLNDHLEELSDLPIMLVENEDDLHLSADMFGISDSYDHALNLISIYGQNLGQIALFNTIGVMDDRTFNDFHERINKSIEFLQKYIRRSAIWKG